MTTPILAPTPRGLHVRPSSQIRSGRTDLIVLALVVASLLPVQVRVGGFPISPHHLLAAPALLVALLCRAPFVGTTVALLSSMAAVAGYGVASGYQDLSPAYSFLHFAAVYATIPLLLRIAERDRRRTLRAVSTLGTAVVWSTAWAVALEGRVTIDVIGARSFAIGSLLPNVAGEGQVNTWGSMLLAIVVIQLMAVQEQAWLTRVSRLVALSNVVLGILLISGSQSRGNSAAAIVVILLAGLRRREDSTRVRVFAVLAILPLVLGAVTVASQQSRIVAELDRIATGEAALFRGRDDRVQAMLEDVASSPLVGTAFRDFEWSASVRGSELASSSPHNQWLGAAHKLGIPLAVAYLAFLASAAKRLARGDEHRGWRRAVGLLVLGLGLVYDVLTAFPSGSWMIVAVALAGGVRASTDVSVREASQP